MENASKALIIAGAILLSILIIAIGMYIYNSSQNSISGAVSQISQQEKDAFNNQWLMYEGEQTGSNVKALIRKLNSNAIENANEATKLPNLYFRYSKDKKVSAIYIQHKTNYDTSGFNLARTKVQDGHVYKVTLITHIETGLVSGILISYDKTVDHTKDTSFPAYKDWNNIKYK